MEASMAAVLARSTAVMVDGRIQPLTEGERARLLALGTVMLDKRQRDAVIDDSFNRYAFNDDDLPQWYGADSVPRGAF